ncbi:galactose-1-phosphate uridylyltransferase [Actinomadura livida]|uniref:Galactose-1-phosphate uridylyltransferase n=1 Tax=Actinomadura livida TaxID=79909 RepID=A0A7W7IIA6_9ACTN|nr:MULTISPECIES: galactose-1-phosphate uridylyltransferase [Actinomadura]MBB4777466.1 UDPglucose--hexose-1-phosphate uridylyltransferase [Actinomadura catellatispora]GGU31326.1 galactose-1-phosphate uridylyltransferase [Actinomadura livida]
MHRTRARLSDGREIVYYDEAPGRVPVPDPRGLPPVEPVCEVRRDPLTGDHVTITAHRNARTFLPPADQCPLCPGGPASEVPDASYEVAVFENRFPSFDVRTPPVPPVVDGVPGGVPRARGKGRCEVVCFTDDHAASMALLPVSRVRTVVDAWADRTAELSAIPGVRQVFVFENRGVEIGVTLHHPHGQIYAYPFVTPRTERMLAMAAGRDLFGEVLAAERAGPRVVAAGEHWTAYVPAAARWPVEVHLMPHRHVPDLAALDDGERDELAVLYRDLLRRCDTLYGDPLPYVAGWHQAPAGEGRDLVRLHLELFSVRRAPGKIKYLAGSESGMAAWINDVPPEAAAARLRGVTAGGASG